MPHQPAFLLRVGASFHYFNRRASLMLAQNTFLQLIIFKIKKNPLFQHREKCVAAEKALQGPFIGFVALLFPFEDVLTRIVPSDAIEVLDEMRDVEYLRNNK